MELSDFEDLIDRFGPSIETWSDQEAKRLATEYIEDSDVAKELVADEHDIQRLVAQAMFVPEPTGLQDRILEQIVRTDKSTRTAWAKFIWPILQPVLASLPLIIGFYVGFISKGESETMENVVTVASFEDHSDLLAFSNE